MRHGRGCKLPSLKVRVALHAAAVRRHGKRSLPKATAAVYDARVLGWIPPIRDQAQCGSCWDFSGCFVCTQTLIKSGIGKADGSFNLSEQYVLDCGQNGGCDGDDNSTVMQQCKSAGLVTDAYGPYQARAGSCKGTGSLPIYRIGDWMYADPGNTSETPVAVQKIKDAIVAGGSVGCAVAAGGGWWDNGTGTDTGTSTSIDHDVGLVGWDDSHDNGDGSRGAWIMRNSWGTSWGATCAKCLEPCAQRGRLRMDEVRRGQYRSAGALRHGGAPPAGSAPRSARPHAPAPPPSSARARHRLHYAERGSGVECAGAGERPRDYL